MLLLTPLDGLDPLIKLTHQQGEYSDPKCTVALILECSEDEMI